MVPNKILMAVIFASGIALSGPSVAQQYRSGELLTLDLPSAVLSPKRIGPDAAFKPGPLDVTIDRGSNRVQASTAPAAEPKVENKTALKTATHGLRVAHARAEHVAQAKRTPIALHRRNPVEAEARDTRVQVWPCKSGGICNWKR